MPQSNPEGLFPQPPAPPAGDRAPVTRPKSVDTAFQLSLAAVAIAAIGTVVTVLVDPAWVTRIVRETLVDAGQPHTEADVVQLTGLFKIAGGLAVAIALGLYVLIAFRMRAGRNWARMLLMAFAMVGAISFLSAVAATGAALELMWNLAYAAFAVAALVYLVRPESAKYFGKGKTP